MGRLIAALGLLLAVVWQAAAWPLPFGAGTGNRVAPGAGSFPRWHALALATDAPIKWLVALPPRRLAAVDRDGAFLVFEVAPAAVRLIARYGGVASPDGPPVAVRLDQEQTGVVLVAPDGRLLVWGDGVLRSYDVGGPLSPLTFPAPVAVEGRASSDLLAVTQDGAVVLIGGLAAGNPRALARVDVRALHDARITIADLDGDGASEAVVLADAAPPGAPGGRQAATSLAVIRVRPYGLDLRTRLTLTSPAAFDARAAVLAPIGASARPAVLTVRTTPGQGGALVAFALRESGLALVAEGPAPQADRFTHLIAATDLSGDGVPEIVAVVAPHADGALTAYRRAGGALNAVASVAGFASHAADSRNEEQALIADLDGDGRPEVVLPRQAREVLVALEVRGERFAERWAIDLKSPLSSNLVAADLDGDGLLDLAVAVRRGLHVFLSVR